MNQNADSLFQAEQFRSALIMKLNNDVTSGTVKVWNNIIGRQIIGQKMVINRLLIALLADGHLLAEGAPGCGANPGRPGRLAMAWCRCDFQAEFEITPRSSARGSLTGAEIFRPQDGSVLRSMRPCSRNLDFCRRDNAGRAWQVVQSALLGRWRSDQIIAHRLRASFLCPGCFWQWRPRVPLNQGGHPILPEAPARPISDASTRTTARMAMEDVRCSASGRDEARQERILLPA